MSLTRRHFVGATLAACAAAPFAARSETFPSRPGRIIVPFPPG
ncbi:MAG: hypothetical protein JWP29_1626, partial [Rhodoferax sp.]|nr:hypothetical protein [Rhodoferax sp.]